MYRTRRQILLTVLKLFDLMMMVLCFAVATIPVLYQSGGMSITTFFSLRVTIGNILIFCGFLLIWHVLFVSMHLYESHRLMPRFSENLDVLGATSLGTVAIAIASALFDIRMVNASFLAVFWASSSGCVILSRMGLRYFLDRVREKGHNLRHVVIVGTNARAVEFARKIEVKPELGYRLIGFIDEPWSKSGTFHESGYPLICDLDHFVAFIRKSIVDEVIIALPIKSHYLQASRIAELCQEQGIVVRFLTTFFNLGMGRCATEDVEGDSVLTLYTGPLGDWPVFAKRGLDIIASLSLLVLLSPILLVTAGLISITSPGPVFFTQERLGRNKRRFRIFKFRTMVPDAESKLAQLENKNEVSGPVFKIKNDPRLTPIGKILRKTSIDELPQLLNVLRGDMSLVGPRPLPVRDYEGFDQDWHRRRFSVRPGITCLWQISGRSSISFDRWMELDMQYIDQWSLWLDIRILVETIPAVVKGSGAA